MKKPLVLLVLLMSAFAAWGQSIDIHQSEYQRSRLTEQGAFWQGIAATQRLFSPSGSLNLAQASDFVRDVGAAMENGIILQTMSSPAIPAEQLQARINVVLSIAKSIEDATSTPAWARIEAGVIRGYLTAVAQMLGLG
jgi:hypothetical protein